MLCVNLKDKEKEIDKLEGENTELDERNIELKDKLEKIREAYRLVNDKNKSIAQSNNRFQGLFKKAKANN